MKIKEHKFPESSFIGGYYIDPKVCDDIINYFDQNKDSQKDGVIGDNVVDHTRKKNKEIILPANYFMHIFPEYQTYLDLCFENYRKKFSYCDETQYFGISHFVKIQKSEKNEGFNSWHFENTGHEQNLRRHLVFMTYLNDLEDGGTEFYYQKITTKAKKGFTLIWPAIWTHTHKGQISKTKEKYIVTGWNWFINERV